MSDPSADKLTIHGCRDDGLNTARVPAAQAQFWTLYATLPDGRVMAIADFKTAAQAHRARTLLLNAFAEPRRYVVAFESDSEGWTTSYDEDGRPHKPAPTNTATTGSRRTPTATPKTAHFTRILFAPLTNTTKDI